MITKQENIILSDKQNNYIKSGWGQDVADNVKLEKISYISDNQEVEGYIARPKFIKGRIPLIIWNRGGYKESGKLDNFLAFGLLGEIASWGYAVVASQYREKDEFGGAELNDIFNLMNLSADFEFINPNLIGVEGWSRGGLMTYLMLSKTDKVKCASVISGISDLKRNSKNANIVEILNSIFIDLSDEEIASEINKRSAITFTEEIYKKTSIMLIHGDKDERISYLDSVDMYNKLSGNNEADYELKIIQNGDHFLKSSKKYVSNLRKNWFAKYLI